MGFPPALNRGSRNVALAVCHGAGDWERVSDALMRCDRDKLRSVLLRREQITGKKSLGEYYFTNTGWSYKGIDMLLLDSGCENIVPDKHMIEVLDGRTGEGEGYSKNEITAIHADIDRYEE